MGWMSLRVSPCLSSQRLKSAIWTRCNRAAARQKPCSQSQSAYRSGNHPKVRGAASVKFQVLKRIDDGSPPGSMGYQKVTPNYAESPNADSANHKEDRGQVGIFFHAA